MRIEAGSAPARRLFTAWIPAVMGLGAIAWYLGIVFQQAINVPFGDDIFDAVKMLSDVLDAGSTGTALEIIYTQHNDHRTVATRLIYLGCYWLTGELNFRWLTVLANLALPGLLYVLYLTVRRHPMRFLIILPAALFLFQLRAWGITLWSMAAFAYFYVFLYGLCSLHCLHQVSPPRFVLAVGLATLATFTLASGQLVWLLGFASLLHQSLARRTAPAGYALCWLAFALICCALWRSGLATPNTPLAMMGQVIADPGYHLLYALTLLGNAVGEQSVALAAVCGGIMLTSILSLVMSSGSRSDPRLELYCCYLVLSVFAMTLGRASLAPLDYALSSRYSFPSTLLLATLWVLIAVRLDSRRAVIYPIGVVAGLLYCTTSYHLYAEPLQRHLEMRVDNFNRDRYWAWPLPVKEANAIVARAITQGIYTPPGRPLDQPTITPGDGTD